MIAHARVVLSSIALLAAIPTLTPAPLVTPTLRPVPLVTPTPFLPAVPLTGTLEFMPPKGVNEKTPMQDVTGNVYVHYRESNNSQSLVFFVRINAASGRMFRGSSAMQIMAVGTGQRFGTASGQDCKFIATPTLRVALSLDGTPVDTVTVNSQATPGALLMDIGQGWIPQANPSPCQWIPDLDMMIPMTTAPPPNLCGGRGPCLPRPGTVVHYLVPDTQILLGPSANPYFMQADITLRFGAIHTSPY